MAYSDLLKHPKWQKKRLLILNRDEFTCQSCSSKETTLHVHHFQYEHNKKPWEYEDDNFITLCEKCHEKEEFLKKFTSGQMQYLNNLGFLYIDIYEIIHHISKKSDAISYQEMRKYFKDIKNNILNGA
jgi:hypothetical protein